MQQVRRSPQIQKRDTANITSQPICADANTKGFFETYDFTKACVGIVLLGRRAVALRVKEKGTHRALGLVGVLHHVAKEGEQEDVENNASSKRILRGSARDHVRKQDLTFHFLTRRFLATTSSCTLSSLTLSSSPLSSSYWLGAMVTS
jgi:hypothetical protein